MEKGNWSKIRTLAMIALSLFAVSVTAVSTLSWFQVSQTTYDGGQTVNSGSTSLSIGDTYGYKSVRQPDANGNLSIQNDVVTRKKVDEEDSGSTNIDQEGANTALDVPFDGIGYYLIRKNAGGTFKYTYNSVNMATKFEQYSHGNKIVIKNAAFLNNEVIRIKQYGFENRQTINRPVVIASVSGASATVSSGDVTVVTGGTYNVWVNTDNLSLAFESATSVSNINLRAKAPSRRGLININGSGDNRQKVLVTLDGISGWGINQVQFSLDGTNFSQATASTTYGGQYYYIFTNITGTKSLYCWWQNSDNSYWHPWKSGDPDNWDTNYSKLTSISVTAGNCYKITRNNFTGEAWVLEGNNEQVNNEGYHHRRNDRTHFWWQYSVSTEALTYNSSASATTNNFYLVDYNKFGGGNTMYADAYDSTQNKVGNVYSMSKTSNDVYTFYSVAASESYDKIKFRDTNTTGNTGKYSGDLNTYGNSGKYYAFTDSGYNGNWYTNKPSSDYITIFLYAPSWNGSTKYCYAYYDSTTAYFPNAPWPGVTMTRVRDDFYSVKVSTTYQYVIFSDNNGHRYPADEAGGISLSTPKTGTNPAYDASTNTWYTPDLSGTSATYYMYDPDNRLSTNSPKAHYWDRSHKYNDGTTYPGGASVIATTTTASGTTPASSSKLYKIQIDAAYTGLLFGDGTDSHKTSDISVDYSTHNNKVYVLTSGSGASVTGSWYSDLASATTRRYWFYNIQDWSQPKAYAWYDAAVNDESLLFPFCNAATAYPGVNMSQTSDGVSTFSYTDAQGEHSVTSARLWYIDISESFDKIIFNNGSSSGDGNQTIDLDASNSNNGKVFVLDGTLEESSSGVNCQRGTWANAIFGIDYHASFFIGGSQLNISVDTLGTGYALSGTQYAAGDNWNGSPSETIAYSDATNGIYYVFNVYKENGDIVYYTDQACSSAYSTGPMNSDDDLYVKYVTSASDYNTFYVDTSAPSWNQLYVYDEDAQSNLFETTLTSIIGGLFKVTLHNSVDNVKVKCNKNSNNLSDWSVEFTPENNGFLYIAPTLNANRETIWCEMVSADFATATFSVYSSGGSLISIITMNIGDVYVARSDNGNSYIKASNNFFLYEHGIAIEQGQTMYVALTPSANVVLQDQNGTTFSTGTLGWSHMTSGDHEKPFMEQGSNNAIRFTATGRYTVYINAEGKVSIASVPVLGNGFYIMPYQTTTNGFNGATKMATQSETRATYNGWIAEADDGDTVQKLYIRSYMDAVDKRYETLSTNFTNDEATIDNSGDENHKGILKLKPGKYNIEINGDTIHVSGVTEDEFFALDPLKSGLSIHDNYTSIVLEVAFTTKNALPVRAKLEVHGLPDYLGVSFYVHTGGGQLVDNSGNSTAYSTMRSGTNYSGRSNGGSIFELASSTSLAANNGETTYYAYILIDYLETARTIPSNPSGKAQFYLKTVQA